MTLVFCLLTEVHNNHLPVTEITGSKTVSRVFRELKDLGH